MTSTIVGILFEVAGLTMLVCGRPFAERERRRLSRQSTGRVRVGAPNFVTIAIFGLILMLMGIFLFAQH